MTLRSRLRLILGVLTMTAVVFLALIAAGGNRRGTTVDALSLELEADRDLVDLESCMQDLQRQMAYFTASLAPTATNPSPSGEGSTAAIQADLADSLNQAMDDCAAQSEALAQVGASLDAEAIVATSTASAALLEDWAFVIEHVETDYVAAVKRQAISAQPKSEMLFQAAFPEAKATLQHRVNAARETFRETSSRVDQVLLSLLTAGYLVTGLVLYGLTRRIAVGVQALTDAAVAYGRGTLEHDIGLEGGDELSQVGDEMTRMAADLHQKNALLEQHSKQLEENLQILQTAQADLVRNQKMAALGRLVAGVAHEVHTPLGVAFTAGTFCRDQFAQIQTQGTEGEPAPDALQATLQTSSEALDLMVDNLSKATHLIQSFKQVAVDRGQPQTRMVDLAQWLDRVMLSLSPMLKKHPIQIDVEVPPDCTCTLAAGELEQVVSNLVMNAVNHGFTPDHLQALQATPQVTIALQLTDTALHVSVADNGRGMPDDEAQNVYEPFFTTRRDAGGSGLGMHIVHQIVHERFEGTIDLDTAPGRGTTWTLKLPHPTPALAVGRAAGDPP